MTNSEIARRLYEIGEYLEMQDTPFKPRAYEKAAEVIQGLDEDVRSIYKRGGLKALEEIPGVGVSIAEKVEEFLKTGRIKYHEELKRKIPVDLSDLRRVEGLGAKSIKKLYEKLGVKTAADLEKAARAGKIRKIAGFGAKSEEKIIKGIEFVKRSGGRFVLGFIMPQVREIEARLKRLHETERIAVAGSVRRRKETIGDVDILIVSDHPGKVMEFFVKMPEVAQIVAHGETKSAVRLENGLDVDLRVVKAESYGAALNYFTGSKDHNVRLRQIAIDRGYKLSEYGLFKGRKQVAGRTEEDLYRGLGMAYIEPEMRENTGEIELAGRHKLPELVGYGDLIGDLQVQTSWTDGANSILEMAEAAVKMGLEYIAITDHTKRLAMTGGLDAKKIQRQWKEIDTVNKGFRVKGLGFRVLRGTECDILKDGSLDLPDSVLSKLDAAGAAIHSHFNLPRKAQTERLKRAMENPNVDIIFHPTGRVLNKRDACDIDLDEIVKTAKKTGTVLEIDAYPDRLDLKDEYARRCVKAGVKLAVNSDAHSSVHYEYLEYGIAQARRGWAERGDIINAWPVEKMMKMLKRY